LIGAFNRNVCRFRARENLGRYPLARAKIVCLSDRRGAALEVVNCVIRHFGFGIVIQPATSENVSFVISNTIVTDNGDYGILYFPTSGSPNTSGVIDHVLATNNNVGIDLDTSAVSGTTANVTISTSVVSNNGDGMYFNSTSGQLVADVDASYASNNGFGITGSGTVVVLLGRSVVTGNATGINNMTSDGTFNTYGDNRINWNHTDISSPMNATADTLR
jgi:hypothetical protein